MGFSHRFMVFASCLWLLFKLCSSEIELWDIGIDGHVNIGRSYKFNYDVWMDENNYSFEKSTPFFQILGFSDDCSKVLVKFMDGKSFKFEIADCIFYSLQSFDYENPEQQNYTFDIISYEYPEQNKVRVYLAINNIDDEPPQITSAHCYLFENQLYTSQDSPCHFELSDVDGFFNYMTFSIYLGGQEDKTFQVAKIPHDWPTTNKDNISKIYTIYNLEPLDYEKKSEYLLVVIAKDSGGNCASRFAHIEVIDVFEFE